jgi:TRAP-type transport system small permease protein
MIDGEDTLEERLPRWFEIDLWLSMAILFSFLILCTLQVVSRFIMELPFNWTEELTAALVIWMTFLGAIAVERQDGQIRVKLMDSLLSPKTVAILYAVFDIAIVVTLFAIILGGWHTLSETSYQKTPALSIPLNVITAAVPLAAFPLIWFVIRNMVRRLKSGFNT